MNLLRISAATGLLVLACAAQASSITFVDFEPPTYAAGQHINAGEDGWVRLFGADGAVTPDPYPPGSGYVPPLYPILDGTQSFVHYTNGGYGHGWGAAVANIANAFNFSFLLRTDPGTSSGSYAMYLSDNYAAGQTPGGMEFNNATDTVDLFGATGTTSTGLSFADRTIYKAEMEVDLAANTFSAYLTDISNAGPRLLAGTGVLYSGPHSVATWQATGGLLMSRSSGPAVFVDTFTVSAVPEPAALSLLGAAGLFAGRRRRA